MSIFDDMYGAKHFESHRDRTELERMLSEAMERGHVEEIHAPPKPFDDRQRWFRDKETGEIYCLQYPTERSLGKWEKIDLLNLVNEDFIRTVQ